MAIRHKLHLHEQVVLLALRDDTGKVGSGSWAQCAAGGVLLAELWFARRITLDKPKRNVLVTLADAKPVGERLLDESLARIAGAKRRAGLSTWVSRISGTRKLVPRIAETLVHRGILRHERARFLIVFERTVFPTVDPRPEQELLAELHRLIFNDDPVDEIEPRSRVLVGIADATGLLRANFDRKELKRRKERIKALRADEPFSKAVEQTITAMMVAIS